MLHFVGKAHILGRIFLWIKLCFGGINLKKFHELYSIQELAFGELSQNPNSRN